MEPLQFDHVVLGGGSAGYAAARVLSDAGKRVALLDGAPELGGLCILRGCMPTKALLQSAEVAQLVRESGKFGIRSTIEEIDFAASMRRKEWLIDDFAGYRRGQLEAGDRFELFRSYGSFLDSQRVILQSGETFEAKGFVIATGSKVAETPIADLREVGYITSDDALKLESLPQSLIILGGGVIAVEFAQFFSRMGVEVTLVQRSPQLLKEFDRDAAEVVKSVFEREGIRVYVGTSIEGAHLTNGGKAVQFEHEGTTHTVVSEEILFALGRTPNTAQLGLNNAGVETEPSGRIRINERAQTSQSHIYAAGDCASPYEVVHLAIHQAEVAAKNLIDPQSSAEVDYRLRMSVVFTEPQVASVGLSEKEAREHEIPHVVASYPFSDHGKSMILDANDGFVKILASPVDGAILGACCVGPHGGELLHEVVVAMAAKMSVGQFAAVPHYHPTLAEIWTYPAEELADEISP